MVMTSSQVNIIVEALANEFLVSINVLIDKEVSLLVKDILLCIRPLLLLTRSGKFAEPLEKRSR